MSNNNEEKSGCGGAILKAFLMIILVTLIGRFAGGFFAGCTNSLMSSGEKTVSRGGISITVPREFKETMQAVFDGH